MKMSFEELWERVWKEIKLPGAAKMLLPQNLSDQTKQKILKSGKSTAEIAHLLEKAVDEINRGSVATMDELVSKLLLGE